MMSDTPPKADVVLRGGTVLTLDGTGATHEAIATQGDRILSVGANTSIDPLIGRRTQVIELDGLTLLPGFNDAHAHMEREGLKRLRTSLAGARSIREITRRIAAAGREVPSGEWIVQCPSATRHFSLVDRNCWRKSACRTAVSWTQQHRIIPCAYLACLEIGAVHLATQRSTLWR